MEQKDIKKCLESMVILYDTREQPTDKARKRNASMGVPCIRQHIDYGDYTYNFTLPDGSWCYETGEDVSVKPCVAIERKSGLTELSGNLIQGRDAFEAEFTRAMQAGARMYLVIEDGSMELMYSGKYGTKVHPNAYTASLWAFISRYKLTAPVFVKNELSGRVIHDILYRELKERLEVGEYG